MMPPELVWAGAADQADAPPVFRLQGAPERAVAWPLVGLRWVPQHIADELSSEAWQAIDVLAVAMVEAQCRRSPKPAEVIASAARAVGRYWPMPTGHLLDARGRWPDGLDVPALWGVMSVKDWLWRHSGTGTSAAQYARVSNAQYAARYLADALGIAIGLPYGRAAELPSRRTLEAKWGKFERALGALGPFFLLPIMNWPAGRQQPPLRAVSDDAT